MTDISTHCSQVTITPRCVHGTKLPEPCIDCEIDRNRSQLEHHLTCASLCARRLAELGHRKGTRES